MNEIITIMNVKNIKRYHLVMGHKRIYSTHAQKILQDIQEKCHRITTTFRQEENEGIEGIRTTQSRVLLSKNYFLGSFVFKRRNQIR